MFKKIIELYPEALLLQEQPTFENTYHWFTSLTNREWLGIPKSALTDKELTLLKTLFSYYEPTGRDSYSQSWFNFLFLTGEIPSGKDVRYRVIQFHCSGNQWERQDIETALLNFFQTETTLFWENESRGIIVEMESEGFLKEDDFHSISETLESDFYIKTTFYIGKFLSRTNELKRVFRLDRSFYDSCLERLSNRERIFTFEKTFPSLVTKQLSNDLKEAIALQLLSGLKDDEELLTTVKVFIENNLNVTLTAKKLYIHRNTLQYRLDKVSEKTGINFKEFTSAFTMYFACLYHNQD
ncbi:helix-turn-helix domain-containing protein [Bacillus sp. 31A1R]|uniref:Helix-turn-helix domain-containing protein n=1 Tax=Robertmurraya mangrovi TaxID=3098077 RepID=A0ABU5ISP6_9BACI|nr:helix-turn-helix domain-containing protein [Bacillus sp. 31A1R]MDZ5470174.1 helix-turn-helix domain-containing protein [Bacillus sp. 31A1R]